MLTAHRDDVVAAAQEAALETWSDEGCRVYHVGVDAGDSELLIAGELGNSEADLDAH
ncbi:hypothetical protein [Microbacterium album]|uniref:Uncharacterized protein n=1 Tax=Microbacterium album TaxID=2053191 RepID=A0A917IGF0_9MICO|nr:hypothetical protein [Microbacterium album]GGH47254.1 hypothetical protein GCM10010921_23850 [Microbacterium album]